MATPLTGDQKNRVEVQKLGVTFQNFPQVLTSELGKESGIVNQSAQSGKRLGAQVMGVVLTAGKPTKATIYCAAGTDPSDKWIAVKDIISTQKDVIPE